MGLQLLPLCHLSLLPPTLPRSRASRCPCWHGDKWPGCGALRASAALSLGAGAVNRSRIGPDPAPQTFCSIHKINSIYAASWQVLNPLCFMPVPEPPRYPSPKGSALCR